MEEKTKLKPSPLGNKVLIQPLEFTEKQTGRAYIPETEKEEKRKSEKGKIVAVGKDYDGELKKGEIIFYDKFGGEYFNINGKEYYAVRPDDIFVVLR